MNTLDAASPDRRGWWWPVRYLYRLPLLLVHVFAGIYVCLCIIGPHRDAVVQDRREPRAHRVTRWWAKRLLRIFGFHTYAVGTPLPDAAMFVCNHVTWLDIELVHSQRAACFVAKAEISHWPLLGWMAACGGTIFHHRGSNESMATVMQAMVERMRAGRSVAVFPEGGTSRGTELRVFHARIFQAALDAGVPVQPVALRYTRGGQRWLDVAFRPKESFVANVFRLMGQPRCDVEVCFLDPVPPNAAGRRHMADEARAAIARALDTGVAPKP